MRNLILSATGLMTLVLGGSASADVVYSNFLNTTIATNYTGTNVTVGDGTLNLFFGGAGVANDSAFQLVRTTAGGLGTMKGFASGNSIGSGVGYLATGSGGSVDHLSSQFTAGSEKYLGFQLDAANYGWMRGTFTYATSGAVIKDWACDTTGATIKAGLIQTDVTATGLTTTTLNVGTSDSFALASALTNGAVGGYTNSLLKQGDGTVTLKGTNTYSGATAIKAGTLLVNGSTAAGSTVTIGGTSASGTPTLGGTGTINGPVVISATTSGIVSTMAPGVAGVSNGVGTLTLGSTVNYGTGSIFEWDLQAASTTDPGVVADASTGTYDKVVAGGASNSVTGGSAVFKIVLGGNAFTDAFWNTNKSWTNIFTGTGAPTSLAAVFSTFSGSDGTSSVSSTGLVTGQGQFGYSGNTLTWTAVPEPTSALAGILLGAGLLRRRRK